MVRPGTLQGHAILQLRGVRQMPQTKERGANTCTEDLQMLRVRVPDLLPLHLRVLRRERKGPLAGTISPGTPAHTLRNHRKDDGQAARRTGGRQKRTSARPPVRLSARRTDDRPKARKWTPKPDLRIPCINDDVHNPQ